MKSESRMYNQHRTFKHETARVLDFSRLEIETVVEKIQRLESLGREARGGRKPPYVYSIRMRKLLRKMRGLILLHRESHDPLFVEPVADAWPFADDLVGKFSAVLELDSPHPQMMNNLQSYRNDCFDGGAKLFDWALPSDFCIPGPKEPGLRALVQSFSFHPKLKRLLVSDPPAMGCRRLCSLRTRLHCGYPSRRPVATGWPVAIRSSTTALPDPRPSRPVSFYWLYCLSWRFPSV